MPMSNIDPKSLRYLRVVAAALLPLLIAGLFVGGAQPVAVGLFPVPWDKVAHLAVFAMFAALFGVAGGALPLRRSGLLVLAFAAAVAVGAADELHQATLPGRQAGWDDLLADGAGALAGCWLLARLGLVR